MGRGGRSSRTEEIVKIRHLAAFVCPIFLAAGSAGAQEWTPQQEQRQERKAEYSPYVERHFPQRVYWGDTHHHSSYSFDSGMFGNTPGPEESFRFAQGVEVVASDGVRAKLVRSLDSLVVSDHAAYLGFAELMKTADPRLMATKGGREMVEGYQAGGEEAWLFVVSMMKELAGAQCHFTNSISPGRHVLSNQGSVGL